MGLYRRKDSDIWWMSFSVNNVRHRRTTETSDRKLAEKIYAKVQTQITEGKWFELDAGRQHTFDEMMEKYLREYSRVHKAESTYRKDKALLGHLNKVFSGLTLNQITSRMITEYKTSRLTKGASPATVRNELRLLSHSFNVAMKQWEWVSNNPTMRVSFRELKAKTINRWLAEEEEEALLKAVEDRLYGQLRDIVIVALNTGMSQEEILKLQWRNVDLFRKAITTTRQKTTRTRTIPINNTVFELLKQRMKVKPIIGSGCNVFFNGAGNMIDAAKLKRAFIAAVEAAKIEDFRFHDLRHTFATRLVQRGVDLYKVAKLLGHADVSTTQRYAHHYPESLRDGVEILDSLNVRRATEQTICHDFVTVDGIEEQNGVRATF